MAAVAESSTPVELVEPGTPGAIECQATGCSNWFVKRSGRHIYCKAPNCTYKRTTSPPPRELEEPEGAAAEVLRRLQDPEGGGDVSPELLGQRVREVLLAQRAKDADAMFGALIDAAVTFTRSADRVRDGSWPMQSARGAAPVAAQQAQVGIAGAALASHARTITLAERRVEAVWTMLAARDALAEAEQGLAATIGTEQSVVAEAQCRERRIAYERAERALQSVEAAWAERLESVRELVTATQGGANGRGRAAA
jgi:hypothetical protein